MPFKKKEPPLMLPSGESDGKKEESSTPMSSPPEENVELRPEVHSVQLKDPIDLPDRSSLRGLSILQNLLLVELDSGILILPKAGKWRFKVPNENIRAIRYVDA